MPRSSSLSNHLHVQRERNRMNSRLAFLFTLFAIMAFTLANFGCASDPNGQAAELRALYKEAQTKADEICADKGVNPDRCAKLQKKIASLEPVVAAVEVGAAVATQDPGKAINFQALWATAKPKVEAALLD